MKESAGQLQRSVSQSELECDWAEWPIVGFVLTTIVSFSLVALQLMDAVHFIWTAYSLPDGVRVAGLKYANLSIVPLIALASYRVSRLGPKSWPAVLLMIGIPLYFVKNWRGTQTLQGTFDRIDGSLSGWAITLIIGAVLGFAIGVLRKPSVSERQIIGDAVVGLAGLAAATIFSAVGVQMRNTSSLFAPGRPYALALAFVLCAILVAAAHVSNRRLS